MEEFFKSIREGAVKFKEWLNKAPFFNIYSHLDADGISSSVIMINLLKRFGKQFHLRILEQLEEGTIKEISGDYIILLDFGSGQIDRLKHIYEKSKLLILDHHRVKETPKSENLIHINPTIYGIDGGSAVSASGVVYLFSREFYKSRENASLALIGARGDLQEINSSINSMILKESNLEERKDLNIYGLNTRPIHKALEYTDKNFIPGVSGSETGAVNFLAELGIPLKDGDEWRTIGELSSEEKQNLISGIIVRRAGLKDPENIFKTIYELKLGDEKKTLDEWAATLNACGRMGMPGVGVEALISKGHNERLNIVLKAYSNMISDALRMLEKKEFDIRETKNALYFIAGNKINPRIVGTLCSIKSVHCDKPFIVGLAENGEKIKISVRRVKSKLNANEVVAMAVKEIGEGGGHAQAAGAIIKKGFEEKFIEMFENTLENLNSQIL